jgi:hypothetical protein
VSSSSSGKPAIGIAVVIRRDLVNEISVAGRSKQMTSLRIFDQIQREAVRQSFVGLVVLCVAGATRDNIKELGTDCLSVTREIRPRILAWRCCGNCALFSIQVAWIGTFLTMDPPRMTAAAFCVVGGCRFPWLVHFLLLMDLLFFICLSVHLSLLLRISTLAKRAFLAIVASTGTML